MNGVREIKHKDNLLAIIVEAPGMDIGVGVRFVTPTTLTQQLGYIVHRAGALIPPHFHYPYVYSESEGPAVVNAIETLFIRRGMLRVDFYYQASAEGYLGSETLGAGDAIMLIWGGHGFKVLRELEMYEVRQGPYREGNDKFRFEPVDESRVRRLYD